MSILMQWAGSVIFAAAISAVLLMLTPKGVNEKIMKTVVGVFFVCCAALPLICNFTDISSQLTSSAMQSIEYSDTLQNTAKQQIIIQTKLVLTQSAREIFEGTQCSAAKAEFELSVDEQNRVLIDSITVTLSERDSQKVEEICKLFLNNYGKTPQIIIN